jgi:hypothetical protein
MMILLAGAGLEKALTALVNYLKQLRMDPKLQSMVSDPSKQQDEDSYMQESQALTIIDTTILKALLKLNDNALTDFLKKPNNIHLKEGENILINYKAYYFHLLQS